MKNSNVLIFKASPGDKCTNDAKDPYQEHLESRNLNVTVVNVLDFKYSNLEILQHKLEKPQDYSALVFGSPRCVHAVTRAVDKIDCRWQNIPVFAVGETTGRVVREKLGLSALGTESGHGAALAPLILQLPEYFRSDLVFSKEVIPTVGMASIKNTVSLRKFSGTDNLSQPVLIPCGNLSRETIVNILQDNGVLTDVVQVYETVQHPELENNLKQVIDTLSINVIVYFSPSGIHATLPLLKKFSVPLNDIKIVSIGPTTEKALEELGIRVSATSSKPTPESLASTVASILTP